MSTDFLEFGTPQQQLWGRAHRVKSLTRVGLPRLDAWNYGPCENHEEPTPSCEFRKCGGDFFDHQTKSIAWFYMAKRGLDASVTGAGKTNIALGTLALAKQRGETIKCIIVCQTPAVLQWQDEAARFAPGLKTLAITSGLSKAKRIAIYAKNWEVLVVGHHLMSRDIAELEMLEPIQVVSDDVDPILNPTNATHKAMLKLTTGADRVLTFNATSLQAQPLSSQVLTPEGWHKMGDIHPGSIVLTPDGTPAEVSGVSPRSEAQVYRVTLSDGSVTRATGDHLWQVSYRSGPQTKNVVFSTDELLRRGLTIQRKSSGEKRWKFALPTPKLRTPDVELPVPPYTLGVLWGDGCLRRGTPEFTSVDAEIVQRVEQENPTFVLTTTPSKKVPTYRLRFAGVRTCSLCERPVYGRGVCSLHYQQARLGGYLEDHTLRTERHNPLAQSLDELGLSGHLSYTKFIPDLYKHAGWQQRVDLLRGLMDTDGTASGHPHFYTTSPQLAEDVANLTRGLGGWSRVIRSERSEGCGYIFYVSVTLSGINPFYLTRKAEKWTGVTRRARKIVSIEPDGVEETQCILVDHPDHLYVTDDYVVTHNTRIQQLWAATSFIGGKEVWGTLDGFDKYIKREPVYFNLHASDGSTERRKTISATGYKNLNDFRSKFNPMVIRHSYEDMTDIRLPDIMPAQHIWLDMYPAQRAKYEDLQKGVLELQKKDEPPQQKMVSALAAYTHGQQICTGLPALGEADGPGRAVKLDWLEFGLTGQWSDRKVVVFARNRGTIMAIHERLQRLSIGYATIWGAEANADHRKNETRRFWEDPSCRVMIGSSAMERSLNLHVSNIIVFLDTIPNPARMTQLIGRIRRAGSMHERVWTFYPLVRNSQEERYMQILGTRQAVIDNINNEDNGDLFHRLTPDEMLRLISG